MTIENYDQIIQNVPEDDEKEYCFKCDSEIEGSPTYDRYDNTFCDEDCLLEYYKG